MNKNYFKSFLIGTSLVTVFPFYLAVMHAKNKNYTYQTYTFISPLFFGIMNMISLYIGDKNKLSLKQRLLYISLISPLIVFIFAKIHDAYNYDFNEWLTYFVKITVQHLFVYNIIIYILESELR